MGQKSALKLDIWGQKWHFRAPMKLKKLAVYDPVPVVKLQFLHRGEVELRRCGMIPNLYASAEGEIYVLKRLNQHMSDRQPTVKLNKVTLLARQLVLDAFRPGWELDGELVKPINGDDTDVRLENLEVRQKGKGRPRGQGELVKQVLAVELVLLNGGDIKAAADELGVSQLYVERAIITWYPGLIEGAATKWGQYAPPADTHIVDE